MRILTFSSLYPNGVVPSHGIFVEHRLRQLLRQEPDIQARVVAPIPWFPFKSDLFGSYARYARVPDRESRHGLAVLHPRYPVIPRFGMNLAPQLMYRAVRRSVAGLRIDFDFDLIDAHYFYPDGVAAMLLAREFKKPFVVTGRGTDLNLIPRYPKPRRLIQQVIAESAHMITVAGALKQYLLDLGAPDQQVTVLRNGVDLELFQPAADRAALRQELGMSGPTLLSVGHLIERKGHHLVVEAMQRLRDWQLVIVGDGQMEDALRQSVRARGLQDRVRFAGRVDQQRLRDYYAAADCLVLASSREGWANVLLEAMACGTPVVASPVDGTPEVVARAEAGLLMRERTPEAIVDALGLLADTLPDRAATRRYAEGFDWRETSAGQRKVFELALRGRA